MIPKDLNLIKSMFIEESRYVWSNFDKAVNPATVKVVLMDNTGSSVPLMSIQSGHRDHRTKAIGRVLLHRIPYIVLNVREDALELSEKEFRSTLRHESIHLGYPRHDKDFRYLANQVGAPFREFDIESN